MTVRSEQLLTAGFAHVAMAQLSRSDEENAEQWTSENVAGLFATR
jgi:hypothetical protein